MPTATVDAAAATGHGFPRKGRAIISGRFQDPDPTYFWINLHCCDRTAAAAAGSTGVSIQLRNRTKKLGARPFGKSRLMTCSGACLVQV